MRNAAEVRPYQDQDTSKKIQVAQMFDNISPQYDFLNHFLSAGIDILWRKEAIKLLREAAPQRILDVATGTADLAIEAMHLCPTQIIGVDISEGMLEIGRKKLKKKNLDAIISLEQGDAENLRFEDNLFDAVLVSFGVRNFEDLEAGLANLYRVLKPGGYLVVLEFSKPRLAPFKQAYNFYFQNILPQIGRLISKDNAAYTYLPASVQAFPDGEAFTDTLCKIGFTQTICKPLTFGIASLYRGQKPF